MFLFSFDFDISFAISNEKNFFSCKLFRYLQYLFLGKIFIYDMKYLQYVFLILAVVILAIRHFGEMQSNAMLYVSLFLFILSVATPIVINFLKNRD